MKDSYIKYCQNPIPIGKQIYAYQCEDVRIQSIEDSVLITGWLPSANGKEPYPNEEKGEIYEYELHISKFTRNAIEVKFKKVFKDQTSQLFLTTVSFSDLVNRIFKGFPANVFEKKANFKTI